MSPDPYRSGVRFDPQGSPLDELGAMSWAERAAVVVAGVLLTAFFFALPWAWTIFYQAGQAMGWWS